MGKPSEGVLNRNDFLQTKRTNGHLVPLGALLICVSPVSIIEPFVLLIMFPTGYGMFFCNTDKSP